MSEYPKLMRHRKGGVIVNMVAHGKGTVVGGGNRMHPKLNIGHWSSAWYMPVFNEYKPEIFKTKG